MKQEKSSIKIGVGAQVWGGTLNAALAAVKIYIGLTTNCVSVLTDGYNNAADAVGNVCGGVGVALSGKKPTRKYPHGFGRVEDIVTLFMLLVFAIIGFYFIYSSVERLFFRPPIMFSLWSAIVVFATALVKAAMAVGFAASYKKCASPIIRANMLDSILDACVSAMTATAYVLSAKGILPADAIIGIIIGTVIFVSMTKSFIQTLNRLIGDDTAQEEVAKALSARGIRFGEMNVHSYGRRIEGIVAVPSGVDLSPLSAERMYLVAVEKDALSKIREGEEIYDNSVCEQENEQIE